MAAAYRVPGGSGLGALEVAVPTLATAHRAPAAAGVLIALLSVGGIIGATIYGNRRWDARPAARLRWLLAFLTVALGLLLAVQGLWPAGALLLLVGIPLNPAITTFSLLVDQHVPTSAAGEAFGWLSSALAGGTGGASALAAALAQQQRDAQVAFAVAAIAGLGAAAVSLSARRGLDGGLPDNPGPQ